MSGKPDIYYPLFRIQLLCHFVLSVVNQYGNYCARNLGLIFKQKSNTILSKYLSRKLLSLNLRLKMWIQSSPKMFKKFRHLLNILFSMMDAGVRGIFSGIAQVYEQISNSVYFTACHLPWYHLFMAVRKLIDKFVPADWGLFGKLTKEKGNFRTARTRLVVCRSCQCFEVDNANKIYCNRYMPKL